jgi:hypothetical protein
MNADIIGPNFYNCKKLVTTQPMGGSGIQKNGKTIFLEHHPLKVTKVVTKIISQAGESPWSALGI